MNAIARAEIGRLQAAKDEIWALQCGIRRIEGDILRRMRAGETVEPGGPYGLEERRGELVVSIASPGRR